MTTRDPYAIKSRLSVFLTLATLACGSWCVTALAVPVPPLPSGGCRAATIQTGRGQRLTIDVDGVQRSYILDVPDNIRARTPVPLLFDFHGFGGSARHLWRVSAFRPLAAQDGFITVYPNGLPVHLLGYDARGWQMFTVDGNRDLAFTRELLDHIEARYCIDRARVYVTGFSNGGFFANVLGCTMARRFAAIAPVSGGRLTVPCDPPRAVPVLIHHGRLDTIVPVQRARATRDAWVKHDYCRTHTTGTCEWFEDCRDGAEVGYCEGNWRHQWPRGAAARIWKFFTAHPMPPASAPHTASRAK